jgi:hypothetical protein
MFCLASKYQGVRAFAEICMPHAIQSLTPSGPWGALQALMDEGGQVTMGAVDAIQASPDFHGALIG